MKPNSLYAQLELIEQPRAHATEYSIGHAWKQAKAYFGPIASGLLAYFCGDQTLRVTVKCDRQGNTVFVVYDSINQRRHTFSSEPEVRSWIDQRYNM